MKVVKTCNYRTMYKRDNLGQGYTPNVSKWMDATKYFLKEKGEMNLCCFPTEMCCCIVSCCAPILDHSIIIFQ